MNADDAITWLTPCGWPVLPANRIDDDTSPTDHYDVIVLDAGAPAGGEGWYRTPILQVTAWANDETVGEQMRDIAENKLLSGPWPLTTDQWKVRVLWWQDGIPGWGPLPYDTTDLQGFRAQFAVTELFQPATTN